MGTKEILEFVKIEHTLFSLPFVLIGYILAHEQFIDELETQKFGIDLLWILVAAIGARGLAMALNRIIDRDVDAENPRTANRHLVSGSMTMQTAYLLSIGFLSMLLLGAWQLNEVALMMAWLPVAVFTIYPYVKRYSWLCHLWLGICLGLAPAGAWLAVAADIHGWGAITDYLWSPEILFISLGVMFWITAFDINYARMDVESDRENGIYSFPARFDENTTTRTSVQLTLVWFACFAISDPMDELWFLAAALTMALANIVVILSRTKLEDFQTTFFRVSMLTGWVLLGAIMLE
ncbi:MAG: 4-hydroxybenzoate octaprenyltransferase [Candidatus Thalassarchaeaceae archaeon]|jgi:4-hydroxybenzoate polyprenyltransferase|nr:4-hydroxybenzoate octaprenyltransferase [Euryarchaeota archaeon]MDG1547249.1 4-hydroxybenzoate octaprenyltransferase [Candidatus Thalassarchaeaceae archaeon]DAC62191.1 MAG TPA: 4-hydroxybenzoate octaprenyltransferase [Candidatus Poseidoniales archaeon]MDC3326345.1 putative 4-hydroxybenzoate polyprenyltransferase [Euryarchaeota archaeon]MDG1553413.1 4-hydroxybenzoate octaprenyltransferase [Candidatus Thalassarchaeaceae archaeon]|tara:strand:+ start:585 stop:1463 length:879 start_codon:yes stop_codon:yes gene_type:complete